MNTKIYEKYIVLTLKKKKKTPEFGKWSNMRDRCKIEGEAQKRVPTYIGCSMADCFKDKDEGFQYFADWCQHQIGFKKEGYQLDKDILEKGNQIYGPDTCIFVPQQLNNLFLLPPKKIFNDLPVGVRRASNGKYRAELSANNEKIHLGYFADYEDASRAYLERKIQEIHKIAKEYENEIANKVYEVLMAYDTNKLKDHYEIIKDRQIKINESLALSKINNKIDKK